VLCCLVGKQAVLGECRRVIRGGKKNGGKMVFSVILIRPGLSAADYDIADAGGPTFVAAPATYPKMIERAGWQITDHGDLTAAYVETFRHMYALEQANADELDRVHGPVGAAELLARRARTLDAIERDLLRREIFTVGAK